MASDKQSSELRYVVYMPYNERATCHPIHISGDKEVQDLIVLIRNEFRRHVESEDVYLYPCGELDIIPSPDIVPPGSNASQVRYQNAMEWIRRHSSMEPTDLLDEYSSSVPVQYKDKKMDLIVATDSILAVVGKLDSIPDRLSSPFRAMYSRTSTVSEIWSRLMKHRFIWVRGTPGSGKSILAGLLSHHAKFAMPEATVILINSWPSTLELINLGMDWRGYLAFRGWKEGTQTVFVFYEAQTTYSNTDIWAGFFKNVWDYGNVYTIGFASYGSASSRYDVVCGIPIDIPAKQRISLWPVDHNDGYPAVGLLFTKEEYDAMMEQRYKDRGGHFFDETFLVRLFEVTGGHIGAIADVLKIIEADKIYIAIVENPTSSSRFSWDTFERHFSPQHFVGRIKESASSFKRGLPYDEDLQEVEVSNTLSIAARSIVVRANEVPKGTEICFQHCVRRGWLHSENISDGKKEILSYLFASPLHRWYVEWMLFAEIQPKEPPVASLKRFALDVFRKFNPRMLLEKRIIGPFRVQRPPEARYQDEFYRCSHVLYSGALVTFPEFGTAEGRVDFYVPSKKWGIELLRDGDRLMQRSARFSQSGTYRGSTLLDDYVILDCRTTAPPQKEYRNIENLYHVVFQDNYQLVVVLDNKKEEVETFRLLVQ